MSIKYNTTEITPKYPNTSLTKVYYQTTVVWESSHYQPDEILFESSTAGTYSLDILDTANYEVYCIGGGAGALYGKVYRNGKLSNTNSYASGGSGGGFIGIFNLNDDNYQIIIGSRGSIRNTNIFSWEYGNAGGYSQITNIVKCNGGTRPAIDSYGYSISNGGSVDVLLTPISYTLNTQGNNGYYVSKGGAPNGGASVYSGHGKGGDGQTDNSTNGYVKIIYKGT